MIAQTAVISVLVALTKLRGGLEQIAEMTGKGCGLNGSTQHLISYYGEGGVDDEISDGNLLHRR
jgi:hypothetical protein